LDYYLNLPYKIEIEPIPQDDGGGFAARLPELGRYTIVGDGETIEEAIQSLNEIKEIMLREWLEQGITIPEPEKEQAIEEYSGKFIIRIPKYLHRDLTVQAKKNGVSLNQFIATLLSAGLERHKYSSKFKEILTEVKAIKKHLFDVKNKLDSRPTMKIESFPEIGLSEEHEYSKAA